MPSPAAPTAADLAPAPTAAPRQGRLVPAALLVLALSLHARTLAFPWLEASDGPARALASLAQAWRAGGLGAASLFLAGDAALGARLLALVLFAGTTALAYGLARRLELARGASAFAAALLAAHPLGVEMVAWLSAQPARLGAFFLLAGACLAPRAGSPERLRATAAGLAWLLALAADARLVLALPPLVLAERWLARARGAVPPPVGLHAVVALAAGALLLLLRNAPVLPVELDWSTRVAHAPLALAGLARLWLWPAGLTPSHGHPALSDAPAPAWALAAGWIGLALVVLVCARLGPRAPRAAAGVLLFALLAAGNAAFPASEALFRESDGALAALGLALALAAALQALGARWPRLAPLAGVALVAACAVRGQARLPGWRSEPALQERALALRPDDARAHDALGLWHLAHGRLSAAQRAAERALAARPRDGMALLHLGELQTRRALLPGQERHLVTAREHLAEALPLLHPPARVHARLGEVYQRGREHERAREHLEAAVASDPFDAVSHARLGMVRHRLLDLDGARAAYERALALDPRAVEAWSGLGLVYLSAGESAAAEACVARALALEPDHAEARAALGRLQEQRGERAAAEESYRRAVGVNPDHVEGLYALGALLSSSGREDEALRCLERVLALTPQVHVRAALESARLLAARGEVERPRERLRAILAFNPEHAEARALLERLEALEPR